MKLEAYTVVIDRIDGSWEATLTFIDGRQYHYESSDCPTLLAAVGRDLDRGVVSE